MPDRRAWLTRAAAIVAAPWALAGCNRAEGQNMAEIIFDLGKNIVDTARASGVPKFSVRDVAGLVSYSINGLSPQVVARYTRSGFEITWQPLFAFKMYADRDRSANSRVDIVALQLDDTGLSEEQAQVFIEATIAQFQKGKWKRYVDPEWYVLLTGRSSLLDETGSISDDLSTIDPDYKIPKQDWPAVAKSAVWLWVGDGVMAELQLNNSPGVDGKPAYRVGLEFQMLDFKLKLDAENLARKLKEGDAKGWNSTAEHEANKIKRAAQNKRLIENAIKRGDSVVQPGQ